MKAFFDQVEACAKYPDTRQIALAGALMIPDVGGAMGHSDGRAKGERYEAWFTKWMPDYVDKLNEAWMTGADCWVLRCAVLHQQRLQHPGSRYKHVVFVEPNVKGWIAHQVIMDKNDELLALNLDEFVTDLVAAGRRWRTSVQYDPIYQANWRQAMKIHPNGFPPFIIGPVPVLA